MPVAPVIQKGGRFAAVLSSNSQLSNRIDTCAQFKKTAAPRQELLFPIVAQFGRFAAVVVIPNCFL